MNIIKKNIEDYKIIKTLTEHNNQVLHLSILLNGDIASSSFDSLFIIYNNISFEIKLKIHEISPIIYHQQISNGNIFLCLNLCQISLYKIYNNNLNYQIIQRINEFNNKVFKISELFPNIIITSSYDGIIKIYDQKIEKFQNTTSLQFNNKYQNFNFTINNKSTIIIFISNKLIFLNPNTFISIKTIINSDFETVSNSIEIINDEILLIGTKNGLLVVNYNLGYIIQKYLPNIEFKSIINFKANIFLSCKIKIISRCKFYQCFVDLIEFFYDEKNESIEIISEINSQNKDIINSIVKFNDKIITASSDSLINIWS